MEAWPIKKKKITKLKKNTEKWNENTLEISYKDIEAIIRITRNVASSFKDLCKKLPQYEEIKKNIGDKSQIHKWLGNFRNSLKN